jgi:hypothetical protein
MPSRFDKEAMVKAVRLVNDHVGGLRIGEGPDFEDACRVRRGVGGLSGYWDGLGGHCQLGEAVCGWDGVVKLFGVERDEGVAGWP